MTTFERNPNGTFTKEVETPRPGATPGEAAGYLAVGAVLVLVGRIVWEAGKEWWDGQASS